MSKTPRWGSHGLYMHDLVVIGGGPAGLAASIEAAMAGMSPVVFEPRPYPIDKACGEGLMPAGLACLDRLGVSRPSGRPFVGIRVVTANGSAEGDFRSGPGLGVRRTELSRVMRDRAVGLGVRFAAERVREIRQTPDFVDINGLRAGWAIAADGLHSAATRLMDIPIEVAKNPRWGIRAHFEAEPWSDRVEIHYGHGGEAYVTPVSERLVGVAILTSRPAGFDELLRAYPELRRHLSRKIGSEMGGGPFPRLATRKVQGRVLLVGDAAGFLDPLTGEGIRLGFAAARLAIEAVRSGRVAEYETEWWRMARTYWRMTRALLTIRKAAPLDRLLVPALRNVPGLFDRSLALLGGGAVPRRDSKYQPGSSIVRQVVPYPIQQHAGAIPKSDQLDDVKEKPGEPGGVPAQL